MPKATRTTVEICPTQTSCRSEASGRNFAVEVPGDQRRAAVEDRREAAHQRCEQPRDDQTAHRPRRALEQKCEAEQDVDSGHDRCRRLHQCIRRDWPAGCLRQPKVNRELRAFRERREHQTEADDLEKQRRLCCPIRKPQDALSFEEPERRLNSPKREGRRTGARETIE